MALIPAESEFGVEIRDAPPAHLLIKIESFSKLSKHGVEKHESRDFTTGIYKWRLIIYPQVSGRKNVYVCLSVANTEFLPVGWEVEANCNILLHNQVSNNYFCFQGKVLDFNAKHPGWGFSISNGMLTDGYLVDDNCTFGAEVFLVSERDAVNECLGLFDWKISDFSKLEGVWTSQEFTAGGFQCNVEALHYSFVAVSRWFTSKEEHCGFRDFIPITDMLDPGKGFLINDCCFLETHISVQDAVYKP